MLGQVCIFHYSLFFFHHLFKLQYKFLKQICIIHFVFLVLLYYIFISFGGFMKLNSFYFLYIFFIITLIFSLCFFIPIFSKYGYASIYYPNLDSKNYSFISSMDFVWPTPRIYYYNFKIWI